MKYGNYFVVMGFTYVSCDFQVVLQVKEASEKPAYGETGIDAIWMQYEIVFTISAQKDKFWVV